MFTNCILESGSIPQPQEEISKDQHSCPILPHFIATHPIICITTSSVANFTPEHFKRTFQTFQDHEKFIIWYHAWSQELSSFRHILIRDHIYRTGKSNSRNRMGWQHKFNISHYRTLALLQPKKHLAILEANPLCLLKSKSRGRQIPKQREIQ